MQLLRVKMKNIWIFLDCFFELWVEIFVLSAVDCLCYGVKYLYITWNLTAPCGQQRFVFTQTTQEDPQSVTHTHRGRCWTSTTMVGQVVASPGLRKYGRDPILTKRNTMTERGQVEKIQSMRSTKVCRVGDRQHPHTASCFSTFRFCISWCRSAPSILFIRKKMWFDMWRGRCTPLWRATLTQPRQMSGEWESAELWSCVLITSVLPSGLSPELAFCSLFISAFRFSQSSFQTAWLWHTFTLRFAYISILYTCTGQRSCASTLGPMQPALDCQPRNIKMDKCAKVGQD